MGNQHTHVHHPPSYYSIEYLNGSTGTSVPDILNEYSPSGSVVERSFRRHAVHDDGEDEDDLCEETQVTLSTIVQPTAQMPLNKLCTIQRSKSYVRPENRVLPIELPTKPLRKTNYLKTEGYKRTWRHKSGKNKQLMNEIANHSHASMPGDLNNIRSGGFNRSESESSGEWRRPSSIAAIRDRRHIMQNEIKQFRDKYSRSMENLEEWTTEDATPTAADAPAQKQTLYKKLFSSNEKSSKANISFDTEKKSKGAFKIDPVKVQPLTCSPNQKTAAKKSNGLLSRPPNLTSTPTPRADHHNDTSFAVSDATKHSDKSSGILVKKSKSGRNKERGEVRKSVEFSFDNDEAAEVEKKKETKAAAISSKSDTLNKAKAIILQSRRRQLMEQSINESLDLHELEMKEAEEAKAQAAAAAVVIKKGKLKSKSFNENGKSKTDSIKLKFGIRSIRSKKKDERAKAIDLERDIQIISRFPINSKVYRHYIAGGTASDKLTNSYNAARMVKQEDVNFLSSTFVSQDSDCLNERAIDVNEESEAAKSRKEFDKKCLIDTINHVFDPIYDSIDEYQSRTEAKNTEHIRPIKAFVNPVVIRPTNSNETENIHKSVHQDPYHGLLKSTTSFKPIAKVNPTALDPRAKLAGAMQNQAHKSDDKSSIQDRISRFNSTDNADSIIPIRYNNHVNRKCSMSSEKLEPILEGTPKKSINENNKAKRINALGEAANNQRLNEKLQNEIQRAYEERKKRFNQVKIAIRSNSILSNASYQQMFQSSGSPSRTITSPSQQVDNDTMIRLANRATTTNRINERQFIKTNNNNNSPLPSPPICIPQLQYSVSSCSSVTLPPPPPPFTTQSFEQQQKLNYVESIMKDMRNNTSSNVNENELNNENIKQGLANSSKKKLHHVQQKNVAKSFSKIETTTTTTTTLLSSSNTSSSTTSSSSSSTSSSISSAHNSYSEKYYSTVNGKSKNGAVVDSDIRNNKSTKAPTNQEIQSIFDACTNELLDMDENFACKYKSKSSKGEEGNFILKSKPTLSSGEYTCSNNSYQISNDDFERRSDNHRRDNASDASQKTLPKHKRRGLDEVFPGLKDAIQDAQNHVQILNITENKADSEYEEDNNDNFNFEMKACGNKFHTDDPNWCPASDLGDFEFDDCMNQNNLNDNRQTKKPKPSQNQNNKSIEDLNSQEQPRLIAKPIPIHIKSSTSTDASPIFSKIQTKLSSFESMNKIKDNKSCSPYSTSSSINHSNTVNRIITNTCYSIENNNNNYKWNTNETNLCKKANSNINISNHNWAPPPPAITKCKFEITLYPSYNPNNPNVEIATINNDDKKNNSDDNEYDFLHYDDDLETTTTTVPIMTSYSDKPNDKFKVPTKRTIVENNIADRRQIKPSCYDVNAYAHQQQQNYRRLIKMKDTNAEDTSSDDEKTLNAEIKKQNWQTCLQRANSTQAADYKPTTLRLPANKNKTPYEVANLHGNPSAPAANYPPAKHQHQKHQLRPHDRPDYCDEALDALLYETDRKSSIGGGSDGKRNPIYYSSSSDISNLM